jgi:tripartite ATP-independent transporter DctM subunit
VSASADVCVPLERVSSLTGLASVARRAEHWLITLLLLAMIVVPLLDRALYCMGGSLPAAGAIVSHLTLALTMIGGLLAAGTGRLICTPLVVDRLPPPWNQYARSVGSAVAIVICMMLANAAWDFVSAEREFGAASLLGMPLWKLEAIMPAGFLLIAVRMWIALQCSWRMRLATVVMVVIIAAYCALPWDAAVVRPVGLALIGLALLCGAPMFSMIGGLALVLMWCVGQPAASMAVKYYSLATTPVIPTLPLFAFTGYLLAESGAAARLVRVFTAWFGSFRGGIAMASVLCCAFFTTFTGASGVTILALGGLLLPALRHSGLSERNALGLITGSGSIGLLFPPCLPVILYSIVALQTLQGLDASALEHFDVSMEGMFKAAFLPGVLLVGMAMIWGRWRDQTSRAARPKHHWAAAWSALWEAKWEMLLPVVAIGAMFGGWVSSPVQAAALTALYALVIEAFVHRDLRLFDDLPRIGAECGLLTGGILLILGTAMGLTNFLVTEQVPETLTAWAGHYIHSPLLFLLALNVALLVVGCLMDMYSAIVVVVPLIVPLGLHFHIDPVHLGVIFLVNLELGFLHPPVGINLFLASYRFKRSLGEVTWSVLPMLGIVASAVLLIAYVPAITHWLPELLAR